MNSAELAIWLHLISNMALIPNGEAVLMCAVDPAGELYCARVDQETICETGAIPQGYLD